MILFLNFEKIKPILFTSKFLTNNHYCVIIPVDFFYYINMFFKNELFFAHSTLLDQSLFDTTEFTKNISKYFKLFFSKNNLVCFYTYFFYTLKCKLTLFTINLNKLNMLYPSIENLYNNCLWLERESAEMFGIFFKNKLDNRVLLLDYSKTENPLLKKFMCSGYTETYYNLFENNISIYKTEFIEL